MAKKAMIEREKKRQRLVKQYAAKRAALKEIISDESKPMEERFRASLKLAELPRNSSATRLHNRCQLTGRPHAYYRETESQPGSPCATWARRSDAGRVKSSW